MKKQLIAVFFILLVQNLFAQDIITFRNHNNLYVKIIAITLTDIKFKNYYDLNGPEYILKLVDISGFTYEEKNPEGNSKTDAGEKNENTEIDLHKLKNIRILDRLKFQDVIYLKNGSIYRGTIIEQVPNISLKIKLSDSVIYNVKFEEIEKVEKEQPIIIPTGLKTGYQGIVDVGYMFLPGQNQFRESRIKFNFINGYRFNPYFSLGLGIGVNLSPWKNELGIDVPIFLDLKCNFSKRNVAGYFSIDWGWDFDLNYREDAFLISPKIGICGKTGKKTAIYLGIGPDFFAYSHYDTGFAISLNSGFIF